MMELNGFDLYDGVSSLLHLLLFLAEQPYLFRWRPLGLHHAAEIVLVYQLQETAAPKLRSHIHHWQCLVAKRPTRS